MQTFIPYGADFELSALCLDNKRLTKQCLEAGQIISVLEGRTRAWRTHPIVNMWRGHKACLARYGWEMCLEYERRFDREHKHLSWFNTICYESVGLCDARLPVWLTYKPLVYSHRMALRFKDPEHYKRFFPTSPMILNYVWYSPAHDKYYHGKLSKPKTVVWL